MNSYKVGLVRYEEPGTSVRRAIDLCAGLEGVSGSAKVFIKPNIVFWSRAVQFPKYGMVTTSRVVADVVELLKERGVDDITIGEGTIVFDPKDTETAAHAFEYLGYNHLKKKYGVKPVNVFEREFETVKLDDGMEVKFNSDILASDFVVDIPVLKTHSQCMVSLGIKNIKGMLNINSRKKCHSPDPNQNLNVWVSKLADKLPPSLTVIDGIYSLERGPSFDGKALRSNIIVASRDMLSADMVGAKLLGFDPAEVPHLAHAAQTRKRDCSLSDVEVLGEKIEDMARPHRWTFEYTEDESLPLPMAQRGMAGVSYPKFDLSLCTYCSMLTGAALASIAFAWKGKPWNDVEILTGKVKQPTPGKKTILLGKCLSTLHKNHPDYDKMIAVKTCPPDPKAVVEALHQAGIDVNPAVLLNLDQAPGFFMSKYEGKPDFDESFFKLG